MRPQDPSRRRFCILAAAALGMAAGLGIRRPSLARDTIPGDHPLNAADQTIPMPEEWRRRPVRRPVSPRADLALAIDQRLFPALRPLALDYAARHGLTVALREGACDIAGDALARKTADITGMCRPPDPLDRLPGVRYHTLGIAALGLIVHPSNRLNEVGLAAARRLLGGETGGLGDPVWGGKRPHCAGFSGRRLPPPDTSARLSLAMIEIPAIADMIAEVARNPQGIGCETLWHIARHKARWPVKVLRLEGREATDTAALAAGRYPLYSVFNITSWTEEPAADPAARALVRHLVDNAGLIDPAFGMVPVQRLRVAGWRFAGEEVVGAPA